jgi:cysteine desulfurase
MIYLDHNATTPPHEDVLSAMLRAARETWANPASLHRAGRDARRIVDDARERIAALAGESPRDVVLTSGGTEANNLGLLRPFTEGKGLLVTTPLEHPSVLAFAAHLGSRGVEIVRLAVPSSGLLDPAGFAAALSRRDRSVPALVAIHAVHHESGVIQPVAALVDVARAAGAEIHVDAVQAAGRIDPALWRGGHTVALAAHKLRGPKGIGALVSKPGLAPRPLLHGGSQERGLRPGTVDPVAAAGFGVAAERALNGGPERYARLEPLRDAMESALVDIGVRHGVTVRRTVSGVPRAPHVAHLLVASWRGDELVAALDLEGICVSSGSACAAGTAEPSPAITALVGEEQARGALRISLGETTTDAEIDALLGAFDAVLSRRT